ncbi:hypothetical protein EDC04DRAFT_2718780 [Pisolithus marmoratus]|nr:hypothetical protein EDC04DRAFT_2718780 [Pisolithus marmoratus]
MDELARARAELTRLQCTERTLIEQLLAVRVAMETQKSKINKLVEERPSPINRLPTELLARILSFLLMRGSEVSAKFSEDLPTLRKDLASVSRLWSDLILNTPSFWSGIVLTRKSGAKSLMTQLTRSREQLLDIAIIYPRKNSLDTLWDILIPSRNRWRSVIIKTSAVDVFSDIMSKFNQFKFPCLEEVSLDSHDYDHPLPLSFAHLPALRHLHLGGLHGPEGFSMATTLLTTLSMSNVLIHDRSILPRIATQSLTALTITHANRFHNLDWALGQDTLRFPALQRLLLDVINPYRFLDAIVAPKLEYFDYTHRYGPISGTDNHTFGSKFNHVRHFTSKPRSHLEYLNNSTAYVLCRAFPGVRCASLPAFDIDRFFAAPYPSGGLGQPPADNWKSLERLSLFCDVDAESWSVDVLANWLAKRREFGLPLLHVELIGLCSTYAAQMTMEEFSFRYKRLRDYCLLDFKDMRFSRALRLSTDSGLLNIVRADNKNGITLKNWRELPLDNMDIF